MKKIMEPDFKVEMKTLNKDNIDELKVYKPRKIRPSQVKSVLRDLRKEQHFDVPLVINRVEEGGKTVIKGIDLAHRKEAMKQYFKENPEVSIKVVIIVYSNLDDIGMKKVFAKWNMQAKQSPQDYINLFKDNIPFIDEILIQCHSSIYSNKYTTIPINSLFDAYEYARQESNSPINLKPDERVEKMMEITGTDARILIMFSNFMQNVFNPFNAKDFGRLPAFKTTLLKVLFRIWYRNWQRIPRKRFISRITSRIARDSTIMELGTRSGNKAVYDVYGTCMNQLNNGLKTKKYI